MQVGLNIDCSNGLNVDIMALATGNLHDIMASLRPCRIECQDLQAIMDIQPAWASLSCKIFNDTSPSPIFMELLHPS